MVHTTHLSTKLLLTIVPLIFVALGTSVYLNNRYQEQVMLDQARASAKTYSDIIRESLVDMMLTKERVDDAYLARLNSIPDIQNLRIHFTTAGLHLRESFNQEERLARLKKREQPVATLSPNEQQVFRTGEPIWELKENMFKALIPFKAVAKCQNCHAVPLNHVLGAAEMDISLERISASVKDNWLRSFVVFLMFTSVAIALSIIMYRTLLARRLNKLLEATKLIGSGNLETPLTTDTSGDELDELTNALDMMRIRLRKAQQQIIHSDRLATVGRMAGSIVHDLRSPMTSINLAIQSLQRGKEFTPEKTQQWYRIIHVAIHHMATMAQELLDFSRGEVHLNKSTYSMGEFTVHLIGSVKENLERANIQFRVHEQYTGTATFDPDRLLRALINIINNAQEAMPQGGRLDLSVRRENSSIVFAVVDTGVGIPLEIRDTMFNAFVTSGKIRGTGLGLAITKSIIDQHRGTIEVESELGKGTKFTVRIPSS